MTWWIRVHRLGVVALAAVVLGAVAGAAGGRALGLPTFSSSGVGPVPVVAVAPLVLAIVVSAALHRPEPVVPVRRVRLREHGAEIVVVVAFVAAALAVDVVGVVAAGSAVVDAVPADSVVAGRNLVGYLALQRAVEAVVPRFAGASGAVFLFAAALFGRGPSGIEPWAWPLASSSAPAAWIAPVALVAAAALLSVRGARAGRSAPGAAGASR